jgi:hypothetical protein
MLQQEEQATAQLAELTKELDGHKLGDREHYNK